jgi:hypothetical protein
VLDRSCRLISPVSQPGVCFMKSSTASSTVEADAVEMKTRGRIRRRSEAGGLARLPAETRAQAVLCSVSVGIVFTCSITHLRAASLNGPRPPNSR